MFKAIRSTLLGPRIDELAAYPSPENSKDSGEFSRKRALPPHDTQELVYYGRLLLLFIRLGIIMILSICNLSTPI